MLEMCGVVAINGKCYKPTRIDGVVHLMDMDTGEISPVALWLKEPTENVDEDTPEYDFEGYFGMKGYRVYNHFIPNTYQDMVSWTR